MAMTKFIALAVGDGFHPTLFIPPLSPPIDMLEAELAEAQTLEKILEGNVSGLSPKRRFASFFEPQLSRNS